MVDFVRANEDKEEWKIEKSDKSSLTTADFFHLILEVLEEKENKNG